MVSKKLSFGLILFLFQNLFHADVLSQNISVKEKHEIQQKHSLAIQPLSTHFQGNPKSVLFFALFWNFLLTVQQFDLDIRIPHPHHEFAVFFRPIESTWMSQYVIEHFSSETLCFFSRTFWRNKLTLSQRILTHVMLKKQEAKN